MEVFQAFCAPAVATSLLFAHQPSALDSTVGGVVNAFFWMFTAQTVCCVFINFVTIYKLRHRGRPEEALSWWARFKEEHRAFRN